MLSGRPTAVIYCDRGFLKPIGKTAHGLIRYSPKYMVVGVVDSEVAEGDAGQLLDGTRRGIPIFSDIQHAVKGAHPSPTLMLVGLAPTGLGDETLIISAAEKALDFGLSIHSGLHLFLSDLPHLREAAVRKNLEIVDIRKPPNRPLKMLSGEILSVRAPRLLVTGQDAAVGKRTASIRLCQYLADRGVRPCLIGTGQTAWLQGMNYGVRLDALPLDFAGGEIEAEIVRANDLEAPDLFIIEGQGSLLNPGYSCETMILLTACRPSMFVYVAAQQRTHYVDFPDFATRDAQEEISLLQAISKASLVGIILHSTKTGSSEVPSFCHDIPMAMGPDGDLGHFADRILASL